MREWLGRVEAFIKCDEQSERSIKGKYDVPDEGKGLDSEVGDNSLLPDCNQSEISYLGIRIDSAKHEESAVDNHKEGAAEGKTAQEGSRLTVRAHATCMKGPAVDINSFSTSVLISKHCYRCATYISSIQTPISSIGQHIGRIFCESEVELRHQE